MATIFREVGTAARSRKRAVKAKKPGFGRMLAQLRGASGKLQRSRARVKR